MLDMTMEQHLQQAKDCAQVGDKDGAIANYRSAIELDANQPEWVYNALGHQLLNNNEVDAAEPIFQLLLEKYPNQPEGLAGLAPVAQRRKQWELALERWNECLEKFPHQALWWWYVNKGYTLIELQNFDAAEATFLIATEKHPQQKECAAGLAQVLQRRQQLAVASSSLSDVI